MRRVETMRERWRLTTMEVLHAKLRVRELHEAQHSIQDTFGHHQARYRYGWGRASTLTPTLTLP